jgi:hypothetical protein
MSVMIDSLRQSVHSSIAATTQTVESTLKPATDLAKDLATLTETWRKNSYTFQDANDEEHWTITNDAWDFDLKPWVESRKLLWILPGDEQFVVQRGSWDEFPYKDMPGKRLAQCIVRDKLFTSEVPDGSPIDPFE